MQGAEVEHVEEVGEMTAQPTPSSEGAPAEQQSFTTPSQPALRPDSGLEISPDQPEIQRGVPPGLASTAAPAEVLPEVAQQQSSEPSQIVNEPPRTPDENIEPPAADDDPWSDEPRGPHRPRVGTIPDWLNYVEDESTPSEEELKTFGGSLPKTSALDVKHQEELFYSDIDDPEQRPVKKLRLSWTIKGVRGTKDKPNYARVINSPPAFVDGFYWTLRFYPRGNNASTVSVYIKCTKKPPSPDSTTPESIFSWAQGAPDADLTTLDPATEVITSARYPDAKQTKPPSDSSSDTEEEPSKEEAGQIDPIAVNASEQQTDVDQSQSSDEEDWRLSAQIGMIIYNPAEPRTKFEMSSEHQFNKHNDDWGWTNFHGPWQEIHQRKAGQHQALLRHDTLALDAYVRMFEDPTQALWWHESQDSEKFWDAKSLTGYFPMGTGPLYHGSGVAGLTSWLLLAPVRNALQIIDTSHWREDSQAKPRPLTSQLQLVLYMMRQMRKEESYVNVNNVLEHLDMCGEVYRNVWSFWQALRTSIELEAEGSDSVAQLSDIFDMRTQDGTASRMTDVYKIDVEKASSVQEGIRQALGNPTDVAEFPKFFPIQLDRQKFDESKREWKMLYNKVKLDEEINLAEVLDENSHSSYTLYGFVNHLGDRSSGKFYSVLRPNGPGTKWLAFEDGDVNRVHSCTRRRIQQFEGLDPETLKNNKSNHHVAYLVMYIRNDVLKDYLPGSLEPYKLPSWMRPRLIAPCYDDETKTEEHEADEEETKVEIYHSTALCGKEGLLDMWGLRDQQGLSTQPLRLTVPSEICYTDLRQKIAQWQGIDNVEKIRLWKMKLGTLGENIMAALDAVPMRDDVGELPPSTSPLCLWMHLIETEEDVKAFGCPDPTQNYDPFARREAAEEDITEIGPGEPVPAVESAEVPLTASLASPATNEDVGQTDTDAELDSTARSVMDSILSSDPLDQSNEDASGLSAQSASDHNEVNGQESAAATVTLQNTVDERIDITENAVGFITETTSAPNAPTETTIVEEPPIENGHEQDTAVESPVSRSSGEEAAPTAMADSADADAATQALIASLVEQDLAVADRGVAHGQRVVLIRDAGVQESDRSERTETVLIGRPRAGRSISPRPGHDDDDDRSDVSSVNEEPRRPQPHVYGFLQIFDATEQKFRLHGAFFALKTATIRETVRKLLEYPEDRNFLTWTYRKVYKTTGISLSCTFQDAESMNNGSDGFVLVVGDVLSDSQKASFASVGKFTSPDQLSRYLWHASRQHPVQSHTGEFTLNSFGGSFTSGQMHKGHFHGPSITNISSSGYTYTGPYVMSMRQTTAESPKGTMIYSNGDIYTGEWRNDEREGQGEFLEARTGNRYVGGFLGGKKWGKGITYWEVAELEGNMCQICYSEEIDALFYDCGHVCACHSCAKQVDQCPICRRNVRHVVRMYRS